jgi:hypothetical protein
VKPLAARLKSKWSKKKERKKSQSVSIIRKEKKKFIPPEVHPVEG